LGTEFGRIGRSRQAATRCILAGLLSLLSVMHVAAAQNQPGASDGRATADILRSFQERTFVKLPKKEERVLVRWEVPVRLGFIIDQAADLRLLSFIADDLLNIRQATGHDISVSSQRINFGVLVTHGLSHDLRTYESQIAPFFGDGANYHTFFSQGEQEKWGCAGKMLLSDKLTIIAYLLVVFDSPDHKPPEFEGCILKSLIAGMGVAAGVAPSASALPVNQGDSSFSEMDRIVLNLLYDPRIKSGMEERQAIEAVKNILGRRQSVALMPPNLIPRTTQDAVARADDLLARYPQDPRAHYFKSAALTEANDLPAAEAELRLAVKLAENLEPQANLMLTSIQAHLAAVILAEGREAEAKEVAASLCHAAPSITSSETLSYLNAQHLCP
jgi:hypothetical protein